MVILLNIFFACHRFYFFPSLTTSGNQKIFNFTRQFNLPWLSYISKRGIFFAVKVAITTTTTIKTDENGERFMSCGFPRLREEFTDAHSKKSCP